MPSKRRSWLPFGNGNRNGNSKNREANDSEAAKGDEQGQQQQQGGTALPQVPEAGGEERLRPINFAPNRLATLYVTPSERNLYLAAMSQLDQNPPHLNLWSDPAPSLPQLSHSQPFQHTVPPPPPPAPAPTVANRAIHNSKLMASPEAQTNGGLMVRDEFRRLPPAKMVKFASMALTGGGGLRFTRFPANVLLDLEKGFPANKLLSEPGDSLKQKGTEVVPLWTVEMFASMWKRAGSEELESVSPLAP